MTATAPWLAHYDEGVPATLAPYPNRTLVDYLAEAARDRAQQAALLFKGATITYGELDRLSAGMSVTPRIEVGSHGKTRRGASLLSRLVRGSFACDAGK